MICFSEIEIYHYVYTECKITNDYFPFGLQFYLKLCPITSLCIICPVGGSKL